MKSFILCITILWLSVTNIVPIHSGRTDGNGGHYNHSTGEYHYHHGYPAHQHRYGECPYKSGSNNTTKNNNSNNNSASSNSSKNDKGFLNSLLPFLQLLFGLSIAFWPAIIYLCYQALKTLITKLTKKKQTRKEITTTDKGVMLKNFRHQEK